MNEQEKIARVATEIMGWVRCDDPGDMFYGIWTLERQSSGYKWLAKPWLEGIDFFDPLARWDHAGMVAEKLTGSYDIEIGHQPAKDGSERPDWYCLLIPNDGGIDEWSYGEADTAPAAIVEAALATLED